MFWKVLIGINIVVAVTLVIWLLVAVDKLPPPLEKAPLIPAPKPMASALANRPAPVDSFSEEEAEKIFAGLLAALKAGDGPAAASYFAAEGTGSVRSLRARVQDGKGLVAVREYWQAAKLADLLEVTPRECQGRVILGPVTKRQLRIGFNLDSWGYWVIQRLHPLTED